MESKTKRCVSRILALALVFALCLTLLGAAPGTASSGNGASDLYFSQYIEGTSNNKALEIISAKSDNMYAGGVHFNSPFLCWSEYCPDTGSSNTSFVILE